jgi:hypothetical protein
MATSPDVLNYFIGKGTLSFTKTGGSPRDLGNAPEVEITPEIEKLDHFSSRTGVRSKDRSVTLSKTLTIRIVLDEITAENLAILLLGGDPVSGAFEIFEESEITGALTFTGTNDVGNKVTVDIPSVSFGPSGGLSLIGDDWGQIEITGEILSVESTAGTSFGTITVVDAV